MMRLLIHTTKTWRARIPKFANDQYQRTSIPTLIVGLCTLVVATTGLIYTVFNYNNQQAAKVESQKKETLRNMLRKYYSEATVLLIEDTNLPPDISKDELNKHIQGSFEF
jgi:hypothetical protein